MTQKRRTFKSHESVHGPRTINSGQVSKTLTPMKNVNFWKLLAENPSVLEEQCRSDLQSSAFKRKHNLNEVSYKSKYN